MMDLRDRIAKLRFDRRHSASDQRRHARFVISIGLDCAGRA